MAFQRIKICLTGPICNCDKESLGWWITKDEDGKVSLHVSCHACKSELVVPRDKFVAAFELERPYPGDAAERRSEGGDNDQPSPAPLDDFFLRFERQMEHDHE